MTAVALEANSPTWKRYRLGEILTIINGRAYRKHEERDSGTPVIRIQNLNGGDKWFYSDLKLPENKYCEKGDLLFAWSATFGPYIWWGEKAIYHYHIWKVECGPLLDQKFAYYLLQHITEKVKAAGRGISMLHMTKSGMEAWEVDIPPIDEQKRIAAILDQADALRRLRQSAIDQIDSLRLAWFDEHQRSLDGEKSTLDDVCNKITDGTHQSPKWADSGVPFLFVSNIRNQEIDFETKRFVSNQTYDELTRNTKIEPGDVLYTSVGSYGHAATVPKAKKFLFQRHIAHLKPDSNLIDCHYLMHLLESPSLRRQADVGATGIAQKTVTLTVLKRMEAIIPPLSVQKGISEKFEQLSERKKAYLQSLSVLDDLFSSLQHRAFQGEL